MATPALPIVPLEEFGRYVRRARGSRSLSEAGRLCGVSRVTIMRAERGQRVSVGSYLTLLAWASKAGPLRVRGTDLEAWARLLRLEQCERGAVFLEELLEAGAFPAVEVIEE